MKQRTRRVLFFALSVLMGLAVGVTYGWVVNPVQYTETPPDSLRIDYQTDIVLMAAELYQHEGNITLALACLDFLSETSFPGMVQQAITFAEEHQYTAVDLQLMENLAAAVELAPQDSE